MYPLRNALATVVMLLAAAPGAIAPNRRTQPMNSLLLTGMGGCWAPRCCSSPPLWLLTATRMS
jgi:hypothetical protein